MRLSRKWLRALLGAVGLVILSGCLSTEIPLDDLFPGQVGDFLRTSGPSLEVGADVNVATYIGSQGAVTLRIKQVGRDRVDEALSRLPPNSTEVGYDSALGLREGTFFTFANEYHAAWGNQDWVFVLSASTDLARRAFLASYGY